MTSSNVTPPPKRLHILDDEEIEAHDAQTVLEWR